MPKETKGTELLILSFLFAMTVTSLDTWLFSCMENDRVAVMMRAAKAKKGKTIHVDFVSECVQVRSFNFKEALHGNCW